MGKDVRKIVVGKLEVDPAYQRKLDEPRVIAMAEKWSPRRMGVLTVARRKDGRFFLLDGQHRVAAMKLAGQESESAFCEVHDGLSPEEEAALFLDYNRNRKQPRAWDLYKASMASKDPFVMEYTAIVEGVGLKISEAVGRGGKICAIEALAYAHRANRNLAVTLTLLKRWGRGDPVAFEGAMIRDVSNFLHDYRNDVDLEQFAEKLARQDPALVLRKIQGKRELTRNRRTSANFVLCEIYNHRRAARRLAVA